MGCWNGTCAISQLAILAREPCRIVFLRGAPGGSRRSEAGSGFCYTTGLWAPASLAIPGRYNDYGAIEDFDPEDWRVKQFLDWVCECIVETKEGPNSYHDTAITKDRIRQGGIEELCDILHSQPQRTRVADGISKSLWASTAHSLKEVGEDPGPYQPDALAYCLIREDIYQALIAKPLKGWRETTTVESYYYAKIDEWIDGMSQTLTEEPLGENDAQIRALIRLSGMRLWETSEGGGYLYSHLNRVFQEELFELAKQGADVATALEVMRSKNQQIARFRWVDHQMGRIRKFWSPQSGAGSQDDCIEAHQDFQAIVAQALQTMKKHFDDEEPEEITNAFFNMWRPPAIQVLPQVWRSPERFKLADVVDATNEPIPGITDANGDGDGYGSVYIVDEYPDTEPVPRPYLYFVISEAGNIEQAIHKWPLGGRYADILREVPPSEWR